MKKILLIDTFNFLHRAYHALPKTFTDAQGNPTNAIYGVTSMLINIFDTFEPDYVIAAVDGEDSKTLRVADYAEYKAQRKPMDDDLKVQIDPLFKVIDSFGITRLEVRGYEADDIIGTLATTYGADHEVIIASNDRDLWQLVSDNVVIMLPNTKGNTQWLGKKEVDARLGFDSKFVADFKGLKGDPSDNIPGVKGVGDKTATKLIEEYGFLECIYENLHEIMPASVSKKLINDREMAFLSKQLATIVVDLPLDFKLEESRYTKFDKALVKEVLEKHNFRSLVRRLGFEDNTSQKKSAVLENQTSLF